MSEADVAGVPGRAAGGRRRPPAAVGVLGRAGRGRGPRAAPLRRCGTGSCRPTRPGRSARRRRPGGCPRRSRVDEVERLLEAAGARRHPAGAARPGAAGGALRHRGPHLRGGRARPSTTSTWTAARCCCAARAARSASCPSGRTRCEAVEDYLVRARPRRWPPAGRGHARAVPQRPRRPAVPAERVDDPAGRGRAGRADRARSHRTRCGTRSRPTCSTAERTCASCRSCSATPRSRTTQVYTLVTVDRLREVYATAHPRAR